MMEIYLRTAAYLIQVGLTRQALDYLAMALSECNKTLDDKLAMRERGRILAAMSYARRIQSVR